MARSKEQWKAQQKQAIHTQPQSKSFFQLKRQVPISPGVRSSALFQLGKPSTGSPTGVPKAVLKSDSIQILRQSGGMSSQVIDLTLDDEEEDEPMGEQQPSIVATDSATSDALSILDGNEAGDSQLLQQTDFDMMVPLAEDVESDVDEEWPTVPHSVVLPVSSSLTPPQTLTGTSLVTPPIPAVISDELSHGQTTEEVGAALDAIRRTIPFSQDKQQDEDSVLNDEMEVNDGRGEEHTNTPSCDDEDGEIEGDVDEELPTKVSNRGGAASDSRTPDRIVRVENLEDGEIFEEGVAPKSSIEVQRAIMLERQSVAQPVGAMGAHHHLRNKKQKKRGKKKAKRKLDAIQMTHGAPGEIPVEFERVTRQRPFVEVPPPGHYTLAMMRNGPRGDPMNVRPIFQDPTPSPFRPVGLFVGGPHPPMRPPPPQLPTLQLPRLPFEDSHILRVNRQGSMEMLGGATFPEPPRFGEFKYRMVSMPPPRPISAGSSHMLQRTASIERSHFHPFPPSGRTDLFNSANSSTRKASASDDFDLDSLRAAALQSKVKRPAKTITETIQTVPVLQASLSLPSSPKATSIGQTAPDHSSPEIDELRLEILRSMTRNRNRGAKPCLAPPADGETAITKIDENVPVGGNMDDDATRGESSIVQPDSGVSSNLQETVETKPTGTGSSERAVNDVSFCETDKSTIESEQNAAGDKLDFSPASTLDPLKPTAEAVTMTPEFRPLTACSQSVVIRLSPEDFSPRKSSNDTHAPSIEAKKSSSIQDAINKLRLEIAEREKMQTRNRLLESAALQLSNNSSCSEPSSEDSSSSSSSRLSPGRIKGVTAAKSPNATAAAPNMKSPVITAKKMVSRPVNIIAKVTEEDKVADASPLSSRSPAETTTGPAESRQESGLKPSDTSRGNCMLETGDDVPVTVSCHVTEQPATNDTSTSRSDKVELDFDAIRAEYEQCVINCEEADMHIARLSNEMDQLEKLLPSVESTVG